MCRPLWRCDMRMLWSLMLATVLLLGIGAAAQEKGGAVESFRGTVKAVSASSISIERGNQETRGRPRRCEMVRNAYLALAMVLALGVAGAAAAGQSAESFMGVVKSVSGSSVTIERGTLSGTFNVTSATHVAVQGAT